jgi:aryl-alcohol dehydrogenase-like predicted oxidoreductase
MGFYDIAPKPKRVLGYHRVLAPSAGVKVSPLCLGTMNFGTNWYIHLEERSQSTSIESC